MILTVKSSARTELIDITAQVNDSVAAAGVDQGVCILFVPHTTAAITINESADPDVQRDILMKLKELADSNDYHHAEGNSDAHVKTSLMGSSEQIIVENGNLVLGTWQAIYFCEFDGPRRRKVILKK